MLNEQLNFYSSLHSSRETVESWDSELVNQFFINDNDIPKVDEEDRELCEEKISEEECVEVIKLLRMENHLVQMVFQSNSIKCSGTILKILF